MYYCIVCITNNDSYPILYLMVINEIAFQVSDHKYTCDFSKKQVSSRHTTPSTDFIVFSTAGALVVQQSRGFRAQKILKILSFQADFCFDKVSAGLLETNDIDEANMENKFSSLPYTGKWITISIK